MFAFEIKPEHVNQHSIKWAKGVFCPWNTLGRIQKCDIGKRVFLVNGKIYQVENSEQLRKRLGK